MQRHGHPKIPIFEYSKITKHIYIGTNQCCQSHFSRALLKQSVEADISLEEIRIDQPFGVKYYLWLPVKDRRAPSFKQLLIGTDFIKQLVDNKIRTYVHCEHGHGRAPTLVAAYFIREGKQVNEALRIIRKKRQLIHPTQNQIQALRNFEKRMKK